MASGGARQSQPDGDGVRSSAVEGLRSSALVKLQELSMGGETKAPVRRIRMSEIFNRPIQTQEDLETAMGRCGTRFRSS